MTEKLKPCPLCGSKLILNTPADIMGSRILFMKCGNPECGAVVSFANKICDTNPPDTIKYWNRRAYE